MSNVSPLVANFTLQQSDTDEPDRPSAARNLLDKYGKDPDTHDFVKAVPGTAYLGAADTVSLA